MKDIAQYGIYECEIKEQLYHHGDRWGILHTLAVDVLPDHFPGMEHQSYKGIPETGGHSCETHCHTFPESLHGDPVGRGEWLSAVMADRKSVV